MRSTTRAQRSTTCGAVAVTAYPGLIGALLVGVSAAKALAWARRLPLVPVDHLHGHVASLYLKPLDLEPPFTCLLASGGHTMLLDVQERGAYRVLGTTLDDAAGEAFDKGARLLGLGYPGGKEIDALARLGDPDAFAFPVARVPGLDFSFSGLKTSLLYRVRDLAPGELEERRADLAAGYQRAIVRALVERIEASGAERVAVVGGVAANSELRAALPGAALAPLPLCTDNAAMIASAARYRDPVRTPSTFRSMRALPRSTALLAAVAVVVAAALVATVVARGREAAPRVPPVSWLGLVGGPRAPVPNGQRMIVVLHAPSVAQRLAHARFATEAQERSWSSQALAAQAQVLTTLAAQGVSVRPEFTYSHVLNGFAAALDGRAVALLNQMTEVAGVYPVRAAYPASVSETIIGSKEFGAASGHRPGSGLPGYDGRGVTIALLDTGVDQSHPYLRGKILPGIDLLDASGDATPKADPQDPSELERHGTELAGILVGAGGPGGLHGVAPGAQVLPIRIAGWQPAADGKI